MSDDFSRHSSLNFFLKPQSVFKAYDHDNDGFISEEEFNSFKDNFPMMESFSAMDVDRYVDGLTSYNMSKY